MGLPTRFADAGDSPGLLLWRVTNRWQALQRAALRPFDLTHVQFVLLASLTHLGGSGRTVSQRELAEHARTDAMMTSQVLRALEDKELVRRGRSPVDARARAIEATDAGRELAGRAVVAVERADREFFGAVDDVGRLMQLLHRLDRP